MFLLETNSQKRQSQKNGLKSKNRPLTDESPVPRLYDLIATKLPQDASQLGSHPGRFEENVGTNEQKRWFFANQSNAPNWCCIHQKYTWGFWCWCFFGGNTNVTRDLPFGYPNFGWLVWVVPLPSNSDHQDYFMFSIGDSYKPSFATITGKGDNPMACISWTFPPAK